MKKTALCLLALMAASDLFAAPMPAVQTVFIIVFENKNWSVVQGSPNAPYINSLLPQSSYCQQYFTPPENHPSEANYLWLEAGTNFGILDDNPPTINAQNNTNHLTTLLNNAGISWKAYVEGIDGIQVPLTGNATNQYDPKHNPFVYFDDITGTNDPNNAYGIAHIRPFSELAGDLTNNTVARYNFIVPNLCDDGHDCPLSQSDFWLSQIAPQILSSSAYSNNGALFITWDEGNLDSDGPIGMILLSPLAVGFGYHNSIYYNHGSTLRTFEEIFNVAPLLNDAANESDLRDLFATFQRLIPTASSPTNFQFIATGLTSGHAYILQTSTDLLTWTAVSTNICQGKSIFYNNNATAACPRRFYRVAPLNQSLFQ